eukprot:2524777-Prymnesium_polylepis.1
MSILAAWVEDTAETWPKGASVIDAREIRCPVKVAEVLLQSFKDGSVDGTRVKSLQIHPHCRIAKKGCGWMRWRKQRRTSKRRSRRRTARALC